MNDIRLLESTGTRCRSAEICSIFRRSHVLKCSTQSFAELLTTAAAHSTQAAVCGSHTFMSV